jgi:hypothetical protein
MPFFDIFVFINHNNDMYFQYKNLKTTNKFVKQPVWEAQTYA